jgi:hypothetical protein
MLLTVDHRVHAQERPCGICYGQGKLGQVFLSKIFAFPVSVSFNTFSVYTGVLCGMGGWAIQWVGLFVATFP